jgi:hypothetical protein
VCSNGIDDDGDGFTDYPADPSCTSAAGISESCPGEQDPILPIVGPLTSSTLVGAHDDHNPSCGSDGGPDVMFTINVPALTTLHLDTNGSAISDTVLSLLSATCAEPSLVCDDDSGDGFLSLIDRPNVAAGSYVIAVDAYSSTTTLAPITLNVSGKIALGAPCDAAHTLGGALTCNTGTTCMAGTCQP